MFTMAAMQAAWELLSRVWDWMTGKSEEATEAAEAHAEAVREMEKETERLRRKQQEVYAAREAEGAWERVERRVVLTNKALAEQTRRLREVLSLELDRKRLDWDREEWQLDKEVREVERARELGQISEEGAEARLMQLEEQREELRYRRAQGSHEVENRSLTKEREALLAEKEALEQVLAGMKGLREAVDGFATRDKRLLTQEEMRLMRRRIEEGEEEDGQGSDYARHAAQVTMMLHEADLNDLLTPYLQGEIDLPTELRKRLKGYDKRQQELEVALQDNEFAVQRLGLERERSGAEHEARLEEIADKAALREVQAARKDEKKQMEERAKLVRQEATGEQQEASAEAKLARTLSREKRREADARVAVRRDEQREEDGVRELYKRIAQNGDEAMLRRVLAELRQDGGQLGRRGWGAENLSAYGAENVKGLIALKGQERQWWQETFETLRESLQMGRQGQQLAGATDALRQAAREHAESLGEVGQGAVELAEAYMEQLEEVRALRAALGRQVEVVRKGRAQMRYARSTGR